MAVWGAPFRTDVFLSASSEADAEALLSALENGREYFFSFNYNYPWREVIERKLSGGYVGRRLRYKVSKEKFNPQVIHEVIKLDAEHKDIVKSYPDDDMARKHILINSLDMGLPCFGVVVEGKLVSICCASPFRRNNISWVYTLETFRNKGYGRSVVSAAVIDILEKEEEATYDVDDNNIASIKLCESLGFTPYDETLYFIGRPI
jgi:RimJ/RimL family protein N-acetyltransferase